MAKCVMCAARWDGEQCFDCRFPETEEQRAARDELEAERDRFCDEREVCDELPELLELGEAGA